MPPVGYTDEAVQTAIGLQSELSDQTRFNTRRWLGLIGGPIVLVVLWFAPTHESPAAQHAVAIAALMIVLWATEALDHALSGLIGVLLFWALGVSSFKAAFSGVANNTTWFLFGAILIGGAASTSGLARRIACTIAARIGTSYSRLLLAFTMIDFFLTFLIPSGIARVTILSAIAAGTVRGLGMAPRSNVGRGLLIIVTYSATLFDKMILAGASSILARGILEEIGHVHVYYSQWFLAYLPGDIVTIVCCWGVVLWLYPPEREQLEDTTKYFVGELARLGPYSASEKKCAVLLTAAVVLWMTDLIHRLNPATVGLAVGLLALFPKVGILRIRDLRQLNFRVIGFTAAALGMSRVLVDTKGLEVLTNVMMAWMKPLVTGPFTASIVLYWTAFAYHIFLANPPAMLSTSLPVVLRFASAQGLHPLPIGMIWTFGAGGKIFAYQSAVLIVGYSYGYFDGKDLLKVGLILTLVESLVLLALVSFYWPFIGIS